ncbi:hypothetical protein OAR04_02485 [Flavobacteriales bacterium]|nr:hypothetical protein [Flavobacteriales bacterium]
MNTENEDNKEEKFDSNTEVNAISFILNLFLAYLIMELIFELKIDDFFYNLSTYGVFIIWIFLIVVFYYTYPKTKHFVKYLKNKIKQ